MEGHKTQYSEKGWYWCCLLYTSFVWVVHVEGNERLTEEEILTACEAYGLKPGKWKKQVDADAVDVYKRQELYFICNFPPETYEDFRIGVPFAGTYKEVFNSDAEKYGGSGVVNKKAAVSEKIPWNHYQNSIRVKVPPLGMVVLERKVPEETKAEKKTTKKTEKKKA